MTNLEMERAAKISARRRMLTDSLAKGGDYSGEEVGVELDALATRLQQHPSILTNRGDTL